MTLFCKLQSNLSRGNTIKLCRYLSTSQPRRSENVDADSELQVVFHLLKKTFNGILYKPVIISVKVPDK